jgi:tetratricopeptide (TPR) repeat protein
MTEAERSFALCASLLRSGHPGAGAVLEGCLQRFPGEAAGWRLLGDTLVDLGQREAALVCFERASRAAPNAEASLRVGTTLQALGRPAAARAAFADAAARDPGSVRAPFLEGVAAQDAGDLAAAAAAYEAALALDPSLAEAALNLGTVRQETGDVAGARAAYGRAVRIRPECFGRAAQALSTGRSGELWLDLDALRRSFDAD